MLFEFYRGFLECFRCYIECQRGYIECYGCYMERLRDYAECFKCLDGNLNVLNKIDNVTEAIWNVSELI